MGKCELLVTLFDLKLYCQIQYKFQCLCIYLGEKKKEVLSPPLNH